MPNLGPYPSFKVARKYLNIAGKLVVTYLNQYSIK